MNIVAKILADIECSPIPMATPDIIAIHGRNMNNPRQQIWTALRRLERNGIIRRVSRSTIRTLWTSALTGRMEKGNH